MITPVDDCTRARPALGALALSALAPGEELAVREHLQACDSCRSEAAALTRTARLLGLVELSEVERPARPVPDPLLVRLLSAAAAERRRQRRRRRLVALGGVAAAAVAVAALAFAVLPLGDAQEQPPESPTVALVATSDETGATMRLDIHDQEWGSEVHLELTGVPGGARCSLVATGRDGSTEIAATWAVPQGGYGESGRVEVEGSVGYRPDEVQRYEVVLADGTVIVAADS